MDSRPRLILASRSPRRAELLSRLGLDFDIIPAEIDESYVDNEMPAAHAERLASEKALTVARDHPDAIVIGSDTIVIVDQDLLGKPRGRDDALRMLRRLSGREHEVFTGVAIAAGGAVVSGLERVAVRFRRLDETECVQYVATGEPMDKAGAYGIQGFGSALVESISGDYFAVMGLPVVRTLDLLRRTGWRYSFTEGLIPTGRPVP
jgi:septum formation protein